MMIEPEAISHYYKVQFNHPFKPGHAEWMISMSVGVTAKTIDEAIEAVRAAYPRSVINTVSHNGKIHFNA